MTDEINQDRRRFLGTALTMSAAAQLTVTRSTHAQSTEARSAMSFDPLVSVFTCGNTLRRALEACAAGGARLLGCDARGSVVPRTITAFLEESPTA